VSGCWGNFTPGSLSRLRTEFLPAAHRAAAAPDEDTEGWRPRSGSVVGRRHCHAARASPRNFRRNAKGVASASLALYSPRRPPPQGPLSSPPVGLKAKNSAAKRRPNRMGYHGPGPWRPRSLPAPCGAGPCACPKGQGHHGGLPLPVPSGFPVVYIERHSTIS
jgi:hypothetical protein